MRRLNRHECFINFRKDYPFFCFEQYEIKQLNGNLELTFTFNLSNTFYFYPKMIIPLNHPISTQELSIIQGLAFHIGMVEIISYWKAACSPKLIIKPHSLNKDQIAWWKKLYFNGLGEFFYLNSIETDIESFMDIEANTGSDLNVETIELNETILVPVGGGKDSIVTLELLKQSPFNRLAFQLNANQARNKSIENARFSLKESIEINRTIHPQLLELNDQNFLNGHTPFSSLLAFSSLLVAYLNKCKYIALSNESSASEATIPGTKINHQYSKSIEFESDFRDYVYRHISPEFNYFSFLRPLNELQIAKLFSAFDHHFNDFRSCNVGSKNNSWCKKCPKCLFTYIILAPFLSNERLISIFGHNLLNDESLKHILDELSGISPIKPFECVGTIDDVNIALQLIINGAEGNKLPVLLSHYKSQTKKQLISDEKMIKYLHQLGSSHFLESTFLKIIEDNLG